MSRLLIIEDNPSQLLAITDRLISEGFDVTGIQDGIAGFNELKSGTYDFAIIDIMLPGMSGYDIIAGYRKIDGKTPIMLLSAKAETADKVSGLRLGADDYMTKPFEFSELTARIEALLRRNRQNGEEDAVQDSPCVESSFQFGNYTIHFKKASVTCDKKEIRLSYMEYRLLEYLVQHRDTLVRTEELMDKVWGYNADIAPGTVYTHVSWLRKKIPPEKGGHEYIKTVRNIGYIFSA